MLKFSKIKLNKIITFSQRAPRVVAGHAFLSFLLLFLISLILGALIFYQYNVLAKRKEATQSENTLQFQEKTYKNILNIWQGREKIFEETGTKKYFDIFKVKPAVISAIMPAATPEPGPGSNDYFLFKFYESRGEALPLIEERAKIWEGFGFGPAQGYKGELLQNNKLLEALKKQLQ